jgi:hypothetical protein
VCFLSAVWLQVMTVWFGEADFSGCLEGQSLGGGMFGIRGTRKTLKVRLESRVWAVWLHWASLDYMEIMG